VPNPSPAARWLQQLGTFAAHHLSKGCSSLYLVDRKHDVACALNSALLHQILIEQRDIAKFDHIKKSTYFDGTRSSIKKNYGNNFG
jgi:hypothetical protein